MSILNFRFSVCGQDVWVSWGVFLVAPSVLGYVSTLAVRVWLVFELVFFQEKYLNIKYPAREYKNNFLFLVLSLSITKQRWNEWLFFETNWAIWNPHLAVFHCACMCSRPRIYRPHQFGSCLWLVTHLCLIGRNGADTLSNGAKNCDFPGLY